MIGCRLEALPGVYIVKAGTLDDREYLENEGKPVKEIFTKNRPNWCLSYEARGVLQKPGA
jgi:hypothetical protein